jgi:HSP20 family protein
MSLVRRSNVFDPFSLDLWDPFDSVFRSVVPATSDNDTAAFLRKLFIYPLKFG